MKNAAMSAACPQQVPPHVSLLEQVPCLEAHLCLHTASHGEVPLWTLCTDVVHVAKGSSTPWAHAY